MKKSHCVKNVQIQRFFWSVFSRIRTEYGESFFWCAGKCTPEKTSYLDTFHAAFSLEKLEPFVKLEPSNTYRERYSTHHVLIRLVEILKKLLDQMFIAGMVLMDLSKRLDCISYELFIAKLYAYGFSQDLVTFIYLYLT